MKQTIFPAIAVLLVVSKFVLAQDFVDQFESNASLSNWSSADDFISLQVKNGTLEIANSDEQYVSVVKHDDARANFTFEADISVEGTASGNQGLMVCFTQDFRGYTGYQFNVSSSQTFSIRKWVRGSSSVVYQTWNSHIRPNGNRLSVSKNGSALQFIANGVLLYSHVDADIQAGSIGFVPGPGDVLVIDNVLYSNSVKNGSRVPYFSDRFDEENLNGWNIKDARGVLSVSNGVLSYTGTANDTSGAIYVDGDFENAPVSIRMRYVAGDTLRNYGITLREMERSFAFNASTGQSSSSIYPWQTAYLLTSVGELFAGSTNSSKSISFVNPQKHPEIHGAGEWDTITITATRELLVNGKKIEVAGLRTDLTYNAVGIWVDYGVTIELDDVEIGDKSSPIVLRPAVKASSKSAAAFFPGPVYSLTGRLIRDGRELPAGAAKANGVVVGKGFSQAILQVQK